MKKLLVFFFCVLSSLPAQSAEMPDFSYTVGDAQSYRNAKSSFTEEYQQVVDYLNKKESGGWGYTDILNLWDYRESLRAKTGAAVMNPDNIYAIAGQVKSNASKALSDLGKDMVQNPEYYQIKLLMAIAKPHSEFNIWSIPNDVQEKAAMDNLKNVINTLKSSGDAVALAEKEFATIDGEKRQKAVDSVMKMIRFKQARCQKLIAARKEMYAKGLLPKSPYPEGLPFMDIECCKYWAVTEGGRTHITGFYYAPSGKKVDYTSGAIRNFHPMFPHAGLFALASGVGYHIYETYKGGEKAIPVSYRIVQLGEEVKILHEFWAVRAGTQSVAPDLSSLTFAYQSENGGLQQSIVLK